jgi:hypothetical protein
VSAGISSEATVIATGGNFGGGRDATSGDGFASGRLATGGDGTGLPDCVAAGAKADGAGLGIAEGVPAAGAERDVSTPGRLAMVGVCIVVFCGPGAAGSSIGRNGGSGVAGGGSGAADAITGAAIDGGMGGGGGTGPGAAVPPFACALDRAPASSVVSFCRSATVVAIDGGCGTLAKFG